jgi:hypothetical protein
MDVAQHRVAVIDLCTYERPVLACGKTLAGVYNLIRDGRVPVLRPAGRVLMTNTTVKQLLADAARA